MIYIAHILCNIQYLTTKKALDNCYGPDTSIHMTKANNSMCIKLITTNNNACDVLQEGINITVEMIIPNNSTTPPAPPTPPIKENFGFYYNFSYNVTKMICIDANNPTGASQNFQQSQTVQVTFDSIGYTTTFIAGLVQKITEDNAELIPQKNNVVYFADDTICFSSTVNVNFIGTFEKDSVLNATMSVTAYYPVKEETTFVKVYDKTNPGNGSITYTSNTKLLNICFSDVKALVMYPHLYRTVSIGKVQLFYQVNSTVTNASNILQLYQGTSMVYDFKSDEQVYSQVNGIIMPNYVVLQTILNKSKQTQIDQYQNLMRVQNPNHTAIKQVILFCKEAPHYKMVVYTNTNINFINSTQFFKYDLFQPNQSLKATMDKLWKAYENPEGCTLTYEYHLFGFDEKKEKLLIKYRQKTTYTQFSCFKFVKYSIQGRLEFVPNGVNCTWLNHTQAVTMKIINEITRQAEGVFHVKGFTINQLNYQIPLNFTINSSIMTIQVLALNETMIEQAELQAVSEASFDVMKEKGIAIISFGIVQIIVVSLQIVIKTLVLPRLVAKMAEIKMMKYKAKNSMYDL